MVIVTTIGFSSAYATGTNHIATPTNLKAVQSDSTNTVDISWDYPNNSVDNLFFVYVIDKNKPTSQSLSVLDVRGENYVSMSLNYFDLFDQIFISVVAVESVNDVPVYSHVSETITFVKCGTAPNALGTQC